MTNMMARRRFGAQLAISWRNPTTTRTTTLPTAPTPVNAPTLASSAVSHALPTVNLAPSTNTSPSHITFPQPTILLPPKKRPAPRKLLALHPLHGQAGILPTPPAQPLTLQQRITYYARREELRRQAETPITTPSDDEGWTKVDYRRKRTVHTRAPIPVTRALSPFLANASSTKACFRCGYQGHLRAWCKQPVKCVVCGILGHLARHCKRKGPLELAPTPTEVTADSLNLPSEFDCNSGLYISLDKPFVHPALQPLLHVPAPTPLINLAEEDSGSDQGSPPGFSGPPRYGLPLPALALTDAAASETAPLPCDGSLSPVGVELCRSPRLRNLRSVTVGTAYYGTQKKARGPTRRPKLACPALLTLEQAKCHLLAAGIPLTESILQELHHATNPAPPPPGEVLA